MLRLLSAIQNKGNGVKMKNGDVSFKKNVFFTQSIPILKSKMADAAKAHGAPVGKH